MDRLEQKMETLLLEKRSCPEPKLLCADSNQTQSVTIYPTYPWNVGNSLFNELFSEKRSENSFQSGVWGCVCLCDIAHVASDLCKLQTQLSCWSCMSLTSSEVRCATCLPKRETKIRVQTKYSCSNSSKSKISRNDSSCLRQVGTVSIGRESSFHNTRCQGIATVNIFCKKVVRNKGKAFARQDTCRQTHSAFGPGFRIKCGFVYCNRTRDSHLEYSTIPNPGVRNSQLQILRT